MNQPIWKDFIVSLGAAATYPSGRRFRITHAGADAVIYEGLARPRPNATNIEIRINDICACYLVRRFLGFGTDISADIKDWGEFVVEADAGGGTWTSVADVILFDDWSYDYLFDPDVNGFSFPIDGTYTPGQWLLVSVPDFLVDHSAPVATIHYQDGTTATQTLVRASTASFDESFDQSFAIAAAALGDPYILRTAAFVGVDYIEILGRRWRCLPSCRRFALYYVNAYGGWDAYTMRGVTRTTDALTRDTRETPYNNGSPSARGRENYRTQIERQYEFNTDFMTDIPAERMHHLLNSPLVYAHDLVHGEIVPLILTNSTTEYRNSDTDGGRLVRHAVVAVLAQERERR